MRRMVIGLFAMVCFAGFAKADSPPTTQIGIKPRIFWDGPRKLTSDEQSQIEEFARDHMKNLLTLANQSPPWRYQRLMRYAGTRMYALEQANQSQDLFGRMIKNIESEDEIFAYIQDLENAPVADQPAVREKIRAKMREIVDNFLEERERHLQQARSRLEEEQRQLEEDRANRDKIVERRVERFMERIPKESIDSDGPTTQP